jgi:hypothetical protein
MTHFRGTPASVFQSDDVNLYIDRPPLIPGRWCSSGNGGCRMVLESVVHNQCLKRWKSVYISTRKSNFKSYIRSRATLRSNSRSPGRSKSVRLAKCVRDHSGIRWSSGCCSHSRQRRFQRVLKMKSRWLDNTPYKSTFLKLTHHLVFHK